MATDQVVTRPFLFTAPLKSPAQEAQLISDPSTRDLTEALKGARASLLFVSACAESINTGGRSTNRETGHAMHCQRCR